MFLIAILKVATLQKEGQLNYIKSLTRTEICINTHNLQVIASIKNINSYLCVILE